MTTTTTTSTGPARLMAPWWRSYMAATEDKKLTAVEVKKFIEPHKDMFKDANYGKAMKDLLGGKTDVKLTAAAHRELAKLVEPQPHIWMPTNEQLKRVYGNIAESAMKNGTAKKLDKAPKGFENAPHWDITPKGLVGVNKSVYLIGGQLYLKQISTCFPAPAQWHAVGPAPLF